MSLSDATHQRIASLVASDRVVLIMKGTPAQPQCGFSAKVVNVLSQLRTTYTSYDVLQDAEIREGIKAYTSWPTIPQLYIEGEFVGGATSSPRCMAPASSRISSSRRARGIRMTESLR
jgi:monothiol glutaredoxin